MTTEKDTLSTQACEQASGITAPETQGNEGSEQINTDAAAPVQTEPSVANEDPAPADAAQPYPPADTEDQQQRSPGAGAEAEPQQVNTGQAPASEDRAAFAVAGPQSQEELDFAEEEVALAADAPEFDLGEEDNESEAHGLQTDKDLATLDKGGLLDLFAELLQEKPVQSLRKDVEAIKIAFYKLHRAAEEQRRKAYLDAGGIPEEYKPEQDPGEQRLKDLFGEYRKMRDQFVANLDHIKEENLARKLAIIEELKELVGSSETINNTFNSFRDIQQRWKDVGPVPQGRIKDLWETYNYHVENFYSFIKINKELRDLDLKKNFEAKTALCEEAEALILEPSIVSSFHRLQKLHDQWRETGPVAKEYKEVLWERFREASSRINKQHQEYFEGLKEEQKANLDLKTALCVKAEELAASVLTSRKDWNKASENLLEIQKVWKTIGFAPKKENTKVYERFRDACDKFFEAKRNFYQQLKVEMDNNLQVKTELCEAAESLSGSQQWKEATDELIALQKKWKETGPVPRRYSDSVWKRFRTACDTFFERKNAHFSTLDNEYEDNLKKKQDLLDEIQACDISVGGFDQIKEFQRRWSEIGFVPIKQKNEIQKRYKELMDKLFSTLRGSEQSRRMDNFRGRVRNMRTSGDRRLKTERDRLYSKVKQLESDIALLENNIGFFTNSKNAESMIRDVREKIERAKQDMAATIEKINLIDSEEE